MALKGLLTSPQLANLPGVSLVMRVYAPQMRFRNDDAALVRRLQSGDERAFEEIFKRHRAPLLSYCRHMLSSQDEGEDALQQTFIKAHRSLLGGEAAPRELRPWLYAIARNCCLSAIASRRPTAQLQEQTPSLAGLSEEVSRREDLRELVAGIGRLPEDQRSALLLAELDDLPHAEIAAIVGCEVSKVKALVYQARSSLLADRDARNTPCLEIREQLSVARGGELRRGPLRRHLRLCAGCRDFQLALGAQRQSLAAVLPVAPSAGLAVAILGHGAAHAAANAAGAAAGGTGLAASGGTAATTTAVGAGASAGGGDGYWHAARRRPGHQARRQRRGRRARDGRSGDRSQPRGARFLPRIRARAGRSSPGRGRGRGGREWRADRDRRVRPARLGLLRLARARRHHRPRRPHEPDVADGTVGPRQRGRTAHEHRFRGAECGSTRRPGPTGGERHRTESGRRGQALRGALRPPARSAARRSYAARPSSGARPCSAGGRSCGAGRRCYAASAWYAGAPGVKRSNGNRHLSSPPRPSRS